MGQLFDFLFDPAVWGTVAAWVGAIGTSSAFLLGYNVYRRDAKLRRYEQAIMVRVVEKSMPPLGIYALNPEKLVVEIHNTSEKNIYSVGVGLYRSSLYSIASGLVSLGPTHDWRKVDREEKLQQYRSVEEDWGIGRTVDQIEPKSSSTITLKVPYTPDHLLEIDFVDAMNQRWEITMSRGSIFTGEPPSLKFVGNRHRRRYKLAKVASHIFVPPHEVARFYWNRVRLWWWAQKNGPWGPGVEGWKQKTRSPLDETMPKLTPDTDSPVVKPDESAPI